MRVLLAFIAIFSFFLKVESADANSQCVEIFKTPELNTEDFDHLRQYETYQTFLRQFIERFPGGERTGDPIVRYRTETVSSQVGSVLTGDQFAVEWLGTSQAGYRERMGRFIEELTEEKNWDQLKVLALLKSHIDVLGNIFGKYPELSPAYDALIERMVSSGLITIQTINQREIPIAPYSEAELESMPEMQNALNFLTHGDASKVIQRMARDRDMFSEPGQANRVFTYLEQLMTVFRKYVSADLPLRYAPGHYTNADSADGIVVAFWKGETDIPVEVRTPFGSFYVQAAPHLRDSLDLMATYKNKNVKQQLIKELDLVKLDDPLSGDNENYIVRQIPTQSGLVYLENDVQNISIFTAREIDRFRQRIDLNNGFFGFPKPQQTVH